MRGAATLAEQESSEHDMIMAKGWRAGYENVGERRP